MPQPGYRAKIDLKPPHDPEKFKARGVYYPIP